MPIYRNCLTIFENQDPILFGCRRELELLRTLDLRPINIIACAEWFIWPIGQLFFAKKPKAILHFFELKDNVALDIRAARNVRTFLAIGTRLPGLATRQAETKQQGGGKDHMVIRSILLFYAATQDDRFEKYDKPMPFEREPVVSARKTLSRSS